MIADLQAFTRIRSVSRADLAAPGAPFGPECRQMLDFALDHARKMGFETEDHEGYCGSAIYGDKNNDRRGGARRVEARRGRGGKAWRGEGGRGRRGVAWWGEARLGSLR